MSLSKRLRAAGLTGPHPLAGWKSDAEWQAAATARFATPEPQPQLEVSHVPGPCGPEVRRTRLRRGDAGQQLFQFADASGPGVDPVIGHALGMESVPAERQWPERRLLPAMPREDPHSEKGQDEVDEPLARAAIPGWVRIGRGFVTPTHMVPGPARDRVEAFLRTEVATS